MIKLDEKVHGENVALYVQIYNQIKWQIQEGELVSGSKLTSKRKLSQQLGVSVNTVETAYSQLVSEGFIEAKSKKGYFVCEIDKLDFVSHKSGEDVECFERKKPKDFVVNFSTEGVDKGNFPYNTWRRLMKNSFNEYNPDVLKSAPSEGDWELRNAIAKHIYASRGVNCTPAQVIIGAGMDNLLFTISNLLGNKFGIIMENPVYLEAYSFFKGLGHEVDAVDIDSDGMNSNALPEGDNLAVYVTPSHQFPLGITMPAGRRTKLLNWAYERENRYIIEDDYDSEFRYNSKPIPSVQSIDGKGRVIYLGTFSKTIAPSVRISYIVLPPELMKKYNQQHTKFNSAVSVLEQNILTLFIREGHYERHLNRMRKLYGEKRAALLEAIKGFGANVKINGENAGHHMAIKYMGNLSELEMINLAESVGVAVYPISKYFVNGMPEKYKSTVLIGYAQTTKEEIARGVKLLESVWKD